MTKHLLLAGIFVLGIGTMAVAVETSPSVNKDKEATKATFLITGLHCPPCTRTVEKSLSQANGVQSIKVDWKTKNAVIEFDESVLPAQRIAQLIAATPHMMGSHMHYGGWLTLKVPDLKDEATAKKIKDLLRKVEGVRVVGTYPKQHSVRIAFATKGKVTSSQLIDVLAKEGIKAESP
jgi:copper chaperone CopZ